jgi:hypothetical protein
MRLLNVLLFAAIFTACSDQNQNLDDNGYTQEVTKFAEETKKLLSDIEELKAKKTKPSQKITILKKEPFVVREETFIIPCQACQKKISKNSSKCNYCGHPTQLSVRFVNENIAILKEEMPSNFTGWVKTIFNNGKLSSLGFYKDGKKDGVHQSWWENGYMLMESTFYSGMKDGSFRTWNENGSILIEANWRRDKEHGPHTVYNMDGTKLLQMHYVDGVKIN